MNYKAMFFHDVHIQYSSLTVDIYQKDSSSTTTPNLSRVGYVCAAIIRKSQMPLMWIVSLVRGSMMSVQEHASPVSISTLANQPPILVLIVIWFLLLIMLHTAMEATHPYSNFYFSALVLFKLGSEFLNKWKLFIQFSVIARVHCFVMYLLLSFPFIVWLGLLQ